MCKRIRQRWRGLCLYKRGEPIHVQEGNTEIEDYHAYTRGARASIYKRMKERDGAIHIQGG
jgi:hypothetical protein